MAVNDNETPRPGDIVNNRVLGSDNAWHPLGASTPPSTQSFASAPPPSTTQPADPNDPNWAFNGAWWVEKPAGQDAEWDGATWQIRPMGRESRWDGKKWQVRPAGVTEWSKTSRRWHVRPGPEHKWRWDGSSWKRIWSGKEKKIMAVGAAVVVALVAWGVFAARTAQQKNSEYAQTIAQSEQVLPGNQQFFSRVAAKRSDRGAGLSDTEVQRLWREIPSRPTIQRTTASPTGYCLDFQSADGAVAHARINFRLVGYNWLTTLQEISGGGC